MAEQSSILKSDRNTDYPKFSNPKQLKLLKKLIKKNTYFVFTDPNVIVFVLQARQRLTETTLMIILYEY